MRIYIVNNEYRFLGSLFVTFVKNDLAKNTQVSINKRIAETDLFGGCMTRGINNLEWTLETDDQISERLYNKYGKTPIFHNDLD